MWNPANFSGVNDIYIRDGIRDLLWLPNVKLLVSFTISKVIFLLTTAPQNAREKMILNGPATLNYNGTVEYSQQLSLPLDCSFSFLKDVS